MPLQAVRLLVRQRRLEFVSGEVACTWREKMQTTESQMHCQSGGKYCLAGAAAGRVANRVP
jgi:hypothetical protein